MDKLKATMQKHEGKVKRQGKPPAGMGDVCKGHGAEEKGETKKGGKR